MSIHLARYANEYQLVHGVWIFFLTSHSVLGAGRRTFVRHRRLPKRISKFVPIRSRLRSPQSEAEGSGTVGEGLYLFLPFSTPSDWNKLGTESWTLFADTFF